MTLKSLIMGSSGDSIWLQQPRFRSDLGPGSAFSERAIDISSDGNTCIIGAERDFVDSVNSAGSAFVFTRRGSKWIQQAKLKALDPTSYANFGFSVAISADGNTAVIGATGTQHSSGSGSVYVFTRSGSTWTQQAKLQAFDISTLAFGYNVSISDNGNTIAIAPNQGTYLGNDSSIFVFTWTGSAWVPQTRLIPPTDRLFNRTLRLSSDGNTCACVTSATTHSGLEDAGAGHIFVRSGSTWTYQAKLIANDPIEYAGWSSLDISKDGNTAVIGAAQDSTYQPENGAVYVFSRSGSTWTQQAKLFISDPEAYDRVGEANTISISNDGNVIAIGVPEKTSFSGAVYIFTKSGSTWVQQAKIVPNDSFAGNKFGLSLALNHDGKSCIIGSGDYSTSYYAYFFVR